jgi:steroid 5-alpha reductase family enzyme
MTSLGYDRAKPGTKGTVDHASFPEALFGGFLAIGVMFVAWGQVYGFGGQYVSYDHCYGGLLSGDFSNVIKCLTLSPVDGVSAFEHLIFYVSCLMLAVFIGSLILGHIVNRRGIADPSLVDRLWSIVPAVYCSFLYYRSTIETGTMDSGTQQRLFIIALLTTMWAVRLTWNFARKGGYSGGEDYRWVEVESWMTKWQFEAFNLVFIVGAQMSTLLGICTPAAAAYIAGGDGQEHPINGIDIAAAAMFLAHLYMEFVADCEMFDFQTMKYDKKAKGIKPLKGSEEEDGFIQSGMWSISRHPNYYSEVTMWWTIYLFSIAATGELLNYSMIGCCWLTILFVPPRASLDVTESISSRKYANYPRYQKTVARFIPWFSSA